VINSADVVKPCFQGLVIDPMESRYARQLADFWCKEQLTLNNAEKQT